MVTIKNCCLMLAVCFLLISQVMTHCKHNLAALHTYNLEGLYVDLNAHENIKQLILIIFDSRSSDSVCSDTSTRRGQGRDV